MIGEVHCHTNLSLPSWAHRNLVTPKELVDHAINLGLDFLAITDHDNQEAFPRINDYARQNGLLLLPAIEVTAKNSPMPNKRPHILAYGVPDKIHSRKSIAETIEKIHEQGGLAVAAHPFGIKFSKATYIGAELLLKNNFDGIEVYNSYEDDKANHQAYDIAQQKKCLMFAGSDAHSKDHVGLTRMVVDIPKTDNWQVLLEAIKAGHYSIATMQPVGGGSAEKKIRSTSFSLLFHSLKGKAA
jgi:predicted metal-dependent phosphoesterase TrpH